LNAKDIPEPSFYLKTFEQPSFQDDASIKYIHDDKFWIGIGYKSGLTFIGSTGFILDMPMTTARKVFSIIHMRPMRL